MLNALWILIPDSLLPLLVVVVGAGVIIGIVRPRVLVGVLGVIALTVVAAPFVEALFASIPWWATLAAMATFGIWILRALLEFTVGREAAGHVLGTMVLGTVRLALACLVVPARGGVRLVSRALRG